MFAILLTIHCILCVALVTLVLLQQGKGADMGAAFRGGSATLFGPSGAGSIVGRVTTVLAVLFMVTSILLVKAYERIPGSHVAAESGALSGSVMEGSAKTTESSGAGSAPAQEAAPVVPAPEPQPVAPK